MVFVLLFVIVLCFPSLVVDSKIAPLNSKSNGDCQDRHLRENFTRIQNCFSGHNFSKPHFLRVAAAFFAERERAAAERLAAAL